MKKIKSIVPVLSKITFKENEVAIPGKRVFVNSTKSNYTSIVGYYKPICKY